MYKICIKNRRKKRIVGFRTSITTPSISIEKRNEAIIRYHYPRKERGKNYPEDNPRDFGSDVVARPLGDHRRLLVGLNRADS